MTMYEEEFPLDRRPPHPPIGESPKIFGNTSEFVTLVLDVGAFRSVWETCEAVNREKFPVRNAITAYMALGRGVQEMRNAFHGVPVIPEDHDDDEDFWYGDDEDEEPAPEPEPPKVVRRRVVKRRK